MLRDNTSRRRDVKSADVITFMLWQSVWFWRSCSSNIRVGLCYLCKSFLSYSRLVVHVNYVTMTTSIGTTHVALGLLEVQCKCKYTRMLSMHNQTAHS